MANIDPRFFRHQSKEAHLQAHEWTMANEPCLKPRVRTVHQCYIKGKRHAQSAAGFLRLMWVKEVMEHILHHTNLKLAAEDRKPITLLELQKYFGHLLILSVLGLRRYEDLWRVEGVLIEYPGKGGKLGVKKWGIIHSHLSFETSVVHGMLCKAFQMHLTLGTLLCVDEARIPCRHKGCPHLSYNKEKPAKWALECLTLNDGSRYLYAFTDPTADNKPTPYQWLIQCGTLVQGMGRVHHITADSRFGSVAQAEALQEMKVHCTLCCKTNAPTYLFSQCLALDLPQWRVHMAERDGIVAATYHQKKKLNLVSTWFKVEEKKGATRKERLPILKHYDDTKRWTDQFDQLVSYYHFNHPHSDWKVTLLLGWFAFAHTNAYILYGKVYGDQLDHYDFLMECAEACLINKVW